MRYTEPDPGTVPAHAKNSCAARIEELRRQLAELKGAGAWQSRRREALASFRASPSGRSSWRCWCSSRSRFSPATFRCRSAARVIAGEAHEQEQALPRVEVIAGGARLAARANCSCPATSRPITEAPILARADGYIRTRMVDIGDRVQAGQPLAEIEAPELDRAGSRRPRPALQQAQAALDQAQANYEQGKADMELARVTAQRWASLVAQGRGFAAGERSVSGAVSSSQIAGVQSLEKAIAAQRSNVAAAAGQSRAAREDAELSAW